MPKCYASAKGRSAGGRRKSPSDTGYFEAKNSEKKFSGFDFAVLTSPTHGNPAPALENPEPEIGKKTRYFLLSKGTNNPDRDSSSKRTTNRKYVSDKSAFRHKGELLEINASKSGIYTPVLHRIIDQLDISLAKHRRVLVIRFDLHQKQFTDNNTAVTALRKRLTYQITKLYGKTELGYAWAREQEKAKAQHYHCAIWLDGNLVRYPAKLLKIIRVAWSGIGGHVPVIKNPYYFIDNQAARKDAIYRLSYLAKARGKGRRPAQTKDYQTSRLKP